MYLSAQHEGKDFLLVLVDRVFVLLGSFLFEGARWLSGLEKGGAFFSDRVDLSSSFEVGDISSEDSFAACALSESAFHLILAIYESNSLNCYFNSNHIPL